MARRPNAYSQLIQEGQNKPEAETEAPRPQETTTSGAASTENGNTVKPQSGKTAKNRNTVKITIYPSQEQVDKLYSLMEAFRKRTGMRIKQQDLIRRLIEVADIDTVCGDFFR